MPSGSPYIRWIRWRQKIKKRGKKQQREFWRHLISYGHILNRSLVGSTSICNENHTMQYINKDKEECVFHTHLCLCKSVVLLIISLSSQSDSLLIVVTKQCIQIEMPDLLIGNAQWESLIALFPPNRIRSCNVPQRSSDMNLLLGSAELLYSA